MRALIPTLACTLFMAATAAAQTPFATFDSASDPVLNDPHDLTIGPDGRLYVADKFAGSIAVLDPDTLDLIETFGDGQLGGVHDISFGPDGKAYVAVTGGGVIAVYDFSTGTPVLDNVLGQFPRTEGALAHSNGRLYVMAGGVGQLVAVENGEITASASGMPGAHDVAQGLDGSIWVADNFNRRLVQFSQDLEQLRTIEGPQYGFAGPRYLDIDDFGRLVVADQDAHRVLLIDPVTGDLLGTIGDGTPGIGPNKLDDPEGVAVHGNTYYFSDSDNNRIVKYVVVMN
jgi:sugar lactone lactonase YvrE